VNVVHVLDEWKLKQLLLRSSVTIFMEILDVKKVSYCV